MNTSTLAGSFLAGLALIGTPLNAQQVSGEVVVRGGPVAGRVIVGDEYSSYHRPVIVYRRAPTRRVVVVERYGPRVVERYGPRVIVVERFRHHHGRHWKRHGYRPVVVYYLDGRYYDRIDRRHPGIREVVVFERHGRYYHHGERVHRHGDRDD